MHTDPFDRPLPVLNCILPAESDLAPLRLPAMKLVVWGLVLLLAVIHQDVWFWNDDRLVFGFLPITLAYHASISIAASIVWFLAINFAWPEGLDEEETTDASAKSEGGAA
jgi:hypothetical protein